jgi:hypothetical protein
MHGIPPIRQMAGCGCPMTEPFDAHYDQDRREILAVLRELPDHHHPAWAAHRDGGDADPTDAPRRWSEGLNRAVDKGYNRILRRSASLRTGHFSTSETAALAQQPPPTTQLLRWRGPVQATEDAYYPPILAARIWRRPGRPVDQPLIHY